MPHIPQENKTSLMKRTEQRLVLTQFVSHTFTFTLSDLVTNFSDPDFLSLSL